ncbi:MAG: YhbY family RNA-binding protein [Opitutales bacterium]|jgi:RNA-binding protein
MNLPPAPELSSAERKKLRGQAMSLKPGVIIGKAGVTPSVIVAVDTALSRDGLVKLRIEAADRKLRKEWLQAVADATRSAVCGEVGHTASIFRPKPKQD